MSERPEKLPFAGVRVVYASKLLTSTAKLVFSQDYALDNGPEGCWMNSTQLGERIGTRGELVEKTRRHLEKVGLYHSRRAGRKGSVWFPTLPLRCVPSNRPSIQEVKQKADLLDRIIQGVKDGLPAPKGGLKQVERPAIEGGLERLSIPLSIAGQDGFPVSSTRHSEQVQPAIHGTPDPPLAAPPLSYSSLEGSGEGSLESLPTNIPTAEPAKELTGESEEIRRRALKLFDPAHKRLRDREDAARPEPIPEPAKEGTSKTWKL